VREEAWDGVRSMLESKVRELQASLEELSGDKDRLRMKGQLTEVSIIYKE